jgi:GNAT superfamily N-acetyltransferase
MNSDLDLQVVTYDDRYRDAFARLNLEWIEALFEVEPRDRTILADPQGMIVAPGGEVFFLLAQGEAVGTVAMMSIDGGFDLTKMAVAPHARGKGYGERLIQSALDWARGHDAARVTLCSNTQLTPALSLYRKHGFRTVQGGAKAEWKRCDIMMELDLRSASSTGRDKPE